MEGTLVIQLMTKKLSILQEIHKNLNGLFNLLFLYTTACTIYGTLGASHSLPPCKHIFERP